MRERGLIAFGDSYFPNDCFQYAIDIYHHIVVPEADDAIAVGFDNPCALCILAFAMLATIEFDYQPEASCGEVSDIGTDRTLLHEFDIVQLPVAETRPELAFGLGHIPPKPASALRQFSLSHAPPFLFSREGEGCEDLAIYCLVVAG